LRSGNIENNSFHPHVSPRYRADIDGLRAIAVLFVVAFHAFPNSMRGGFIGVDVFFVISGFLISSNIFENVLNGTFSFADFYRRRIKRIFPALIVVLVSCLAFGWVSLLADEFKQLGKHVAGATIFMSNFLLWGETGYFDNVAETKPLLHLWSLGIEEQFYIVWPLIIWASRRWAFNLLAVVVLAGISSFAANIWLALSDEVGVFYSPQSRFWELVVGAGLAYWSVALSGRRDSALSNSWCEAISWIGFSSVCVSALFFQGGQRFLGCWTLLPALGTCLTIAAGPQAWLNRHVLAHRFVVAVGLVSYPLYLWHWPILSFLRVTQSEFPSPALAAKGIVVSLVLATFTYHFVEKPIRFGSRKAFVTGLTLAFMCSIGLSGFYIFQHEGIDTRDSIRQFTNNVNELQRTPMVDEACKSFVEIKHFRFDYCRYRGGRGDTTVAVVGDSHAHVAFPGIAELLANINVNTVLLANSSCPPLAGTPSAVKAARPGSALDAELETCEIKIEQIYSVLAAKPEIKKVFFFSRGAVYLSGHGFGPHEKSIARPPIITSERFEAGLQRTTTALSTLGKRVYFVLENPESGLDPAVCLERPFRIKARHCDVDRATVERRQKEYLGIFRRLKDATVIETLPSFCPNLRCEVMRDGKLLYADDDHLSVEGSRFQAEKILRHWLEQ